MKSKKLTQMVCVTVMLGLLSGCGAKEPPPETEPQPEAVVGVPVEVMSVGTEHFDKVISVAGKTAAESTVNVIAKVSGMEQIMAVNVKVGDKVSKGQVLARLNTDASSIQLSQAQLAYDDAKSNYDRSYALYEAGAVSQADMDRLQLALSNAENTLAQAQLAIDYATVTAPISGTIVSANADEGSYASASQPMFVIANVATLEVQAGVTESYINKIKKGQTVEVLVGAASAEPVNGTITEISSMMDMSTKNYPITISIDNRAGQFVDGMYAEVKIITDSANDVIVIPAQAMVNRDGNRYVYVVDNDMAREVAVTVGLNDGNFYVVEEGLTVGEQLIIKGNSDLVNGQAIVVVGGDDIVEDESNVSDDAKAPAEAADDTAGGDAA